MYCFTININVFNFTLTSKYLLLYSSVFTQHLYKILSHLRKFIKKANNKQTKQSNDDTSLKLHSTSKSTHQYGKK